MSCNKRLPPKVCLFDSMMGYLGKVEWGSACETVLMCQTMELRIFDETDTLIFTAQKPGFNLISVFGFFPWTHFFQQDFKVEAPICSPRYKHSDVPVALIRR